MINLLCRNTYLIRNLIKIKKIEANALGEPKEFITIVRSAP
jgi:hypothetical protein